MKKILFLLLILPVLGFSQNKYVKPIILFDAVIENKMFNGLSSNVGFLFGAEGFPQIGLCAGLRQYTPPNNFMRPSNTIVTAAFFWKVNVGRTLFIPMFSVGDYQYQDLSIRVGYSIFKDKTTYIHLFTSTQMGSGIGTFIVIK